MSTAALMHSTEQEHVNLDDSPFVYRVHENEYRITFMLYHPDRQWDTVATVTITRPRRDGYNRIQRATLALSPQGYLLPDAAEAYSQVVRIAAWVCAFTNEGVEEELRRLEEARAAREAEAQREREERRARAEAKRAERERRHNETMKAVDALVDDLKWMIEEDIRCKKLHKRSTIFGTIKVVRVYDPDEPPYKRRRAREMDIITERGKPMTIRLAELEWLETKDPDTNVKGKRTKWDRIYPTTSETED